MFTLNYLVIFFFFSFCLFVLFFVFYNLASLAYESGGYTKQDTVKFGKY